VILKVEATSTQIKEIYTPLKKVENHLFPEKVLRYYFTFYKNESSPNSLLIRFFMNASTGIYME